MSNPNPNLDHMRHSLSHILMDALQRLYPGSIPGVGPAIDDGFYHDFESPHTVSEEDLAAIEVEMRKIIAEDLEIVGKSMGIDEALTFLDTMGYKYTRELAEDLKKEDHAEVTFFGHGNFINMCRGGHMHRTSEINPQSFRLHKVAGAYWRGDEKRPMLQRIYGLAFATPEEVEKHLVMLEEAKKRDHRKLGKELDLFTFSELVGSGLPLYTGRGSFVRRGLNDYIEELQAASGYMQVWTPQVVKAKLFQVSGHYDKYKEDMFRVSSNYSDEDFFLKPMNCPQHTQIYLSQARSYRDLPIRMTDFAMLYRDERPGELNGLARARSFSQDDCHIFCREDQVDEEVDMALTMIKQVMTTFGFKYRYRLSTRDPKHPEKYLGDPATWDKVEQWAVEIMKRNGIDYFDGPGEAAFYAPKMDLMVTDALGREWQLSTVQIDYVMPERFGLEYNDSDGKSKRPVMLHRAILGSTERTMMILLEHFAGALPAWLSPTQVQILSVGSTHADFCHALAAEMRSSGIRAKADDSNETVRNKIRKASNQKVPYILVVGDKEMQGGAFHVRLRGQEAIKEMGKGEFVEYVRERLRNRSLEV